MCEIIGLALVLKDQVEIREVSAYGKGVFAMEDLEADQVVTIYPAHIVHKRGDLHLYKVAGATFSEDTFWDYSLNMKDGSVISGDPTICLPGYLGHMINDSTTESEHIKKCNIDEIINESIKYKIKSIKNDNCLLANKNGIGYVVTTKKIKKGEELFTSYGAAYWTNLKKKDIDKRFELHFNTLTHNQKCYLGDLFSRT